VTRTDKTAILTRGEPEVTDFISDRDPAVSRLIAKVEREPGHPLADAVVRYTEPQEVEPANDELWRP